MSDMLPQLQFQNCHTDTKLDYVYHIIENAVLVETQYLKNC